MLARASKALAEVGAVETGVVRTVAVVAEANENRVAAVAMKARDLMFDISANDWRKIKLNGTIRYKRM